MNAKKQIRQWAYEQPSQSYASNKTSLGLNIQKYKTKN